MATCKSYEGCAGQGWLYDLTDSGSGATVYCSCEAGVALEASELDEEARKVRERALVDATLKALEDESFREVRETRADRHEEKYGRADGAS